MLSVQPTEAPSEREFSLSGNVVSKKRTSLSQNMVGSLTLLARNDDIVKKLMM